MKHSGDICPAAVDPQLVGDPVDTLTGAVFEKQIEFRLVGSVDLHWKRHYDSNKIGQEFALGWGTTHSFDRKLVCDVDGISYHAPVGVSFGFPPLLNDGDTAALHGFTLKRISRELYHLEQHGEPTMEFRFSNDFIAPARLSRLIKDGHQVQFHYDSRNVWQEMVDSNGRSVRVVENLEGRLMSLTLTGVDDEPDVLLISYEYDEAGNLVKTSDHNGRGYEFVYDDNRRLISRTNPIGQIFSFEYDDQGRCVRSSGLEQLQKVTLEYVVDERMTKVTKFDGGEWSYFFDESGFLDQIIDPLGGVQKFVRDDEGVLIEEVDPNGNATRYEYDEAGAPIAKINSLGHYIPLPEDINAPGFLAHRVAANPAEYEHGRLLDLEEIEMPDPGYVKYLALPNGADKLVQSGLKAKEKSKLWLNVEDPDDFSVTPLAGKWWPAPEEGREFNHLGKLVTQHDETGNSRRWEYDAFGNVKTYTDFDGGEWKTSYGNWHLPLLITNPVGATVQFKYNPEEELTQCLDAGGTRSQYDYDLKSQLTEVRRHDKVRETYTRDAAGNLLAKHDGEGNELLKFEFGAGNLPTKRTLASGDEHSFEYDEAGRYLAAASDCGTIEFDYDVLGNRTVEKRDGLGVEHTFSAPHVPEQSTYLEKFTVHYDRSLAGMVKITDPMGETHEIRHQEKGLIERHFANGSKELAQYDSQGRCLFKSAQSGSGSIWNRRFRYSGEGELSSVEDSANGDLRYEYDAAHRLKRRIKASGKIDEFRMDDADNLISQPGLKDVALISGNRLGTANGHKFSYNSRDHIASRGSDRGEIKYHYDSRDYLVKAELSDGDWTAEYDSLGRRVRKTHRGETTEFFWNGDQLTSEKFDDGSIRLYIYADPLALTPLLFIDYASEDADPKSGERFFVFTDQIGTPCLVENESGDTVWKAQTDPFGATIVEESSLIDFHFRFPGHYYEKGLDLHYNRFRHYDPVLGRYLQSDPLGIEGGYNLYSYCSNPLLNVDVRGLNDP